jgi:hypothetical protein
VLGRAVCVCVGSRGPDRAVGGGRFGVDGPAARGGYTPRRHTKRSLVRGTAGLPPAQLQGLQASPRHSRAHTDDAVTQARFSALQQTRPEHRVRECACVRGRARNTHHLSAPRGAVSGRHSTRNSGQPSNSWTQTDRQTSMHAPKQQRAAAQSSPASVNTLCGVATTSASPLCPPLTGA